MAVSAGRGCGLAVVSRALVDHVAGAGTYEELVMNTMRSSIGARAQRPPLPSLHAVTCAALAYTKLTSALFFRLPNAVSADAAHRPQHRDEADSAGCAEDQHHVQSLR